MAGEYVSYKAELTDELNNLKKENKFFKEILSEMDKQVYNIEFLKQPMQILEDGQIMPVFKELTDEEINVVAILQDAEIVPVGHEIWKTGEEFNKYKRIVLATAKALRKASEKCNHSNFVKTEHLTGEGAMEYVEWFDNTCLDCGEHWTTNN